MTSFLFLEILWQNSGEVYKTESVQREYFRGVSAYICIYVQGKPGFYWTNLHLYPSTNRNSNVHM